jgi:hypothetical protein
LGRSPFFCKSSWRVWGIISLFMFNSSSTIILRAHQRSRVSISRTFATVSAFREVEGLSLRGSPWRSSRPSLNRLTHSRTLIRLKAHHHRQFATFGKFLFVFHAVKHKIFIFTRSSLVKNVTAVKTTDAPNCYSWTVSWLDLLTPANCW